MTRLHSNSNAMHRLRGFFTEPDYQISQLQYQLTNARERIHNLELDVHERDNLIQHAQRINQENDMFVRNLSREKDSLVQDLKRSKGEVSENKRQVQELKVEIMQLRQVPEEVSDSEIEHKMKDLEHEVFDLANDGLADNIPKDHFTHEMSRGRVSDRAVQCVRSGDQTVCLALIQNTIWSSLQKLFRPVNSMGISESGPAGLARKLVDSTQINTTNQDYECKAWLQNLASGLMRHHPQAFSSAIDELKEAVISRIVKELYEISQATLQPKHQASLRYIVKQATSLADILHKQRAPYALAIYADNRFCSHIMEGQSVGENAQIDCWVTPLLLRREEDLPKESWVVIRKAKVIDCKTSILVD